MKSDSKKNKITDKNAGSMTIYSSGSVDIPDEVVSALEAVLFAAGYSVEIAKIAEVFGVPAEDIRAAAAVLQKEYLTGRHGIQLLMYENTLQLCTKDEHITKIREILGVRQGSNLSRSSLEALAIVAYHQPVTRPYIDSIRGTDSAHAVTSLLDKHLIEVCGKLDAPGKPSLYRTTEDFLRVFGMDSLEKLPPIELFGVPKTEDITDTEKEPLLTE